MAKENNKNQNKEDFDHEGNFKKGHDIGKEYRWEKGQSGNPNGRPRSIDSQLKSLSKGKSFETITLAGARKILLWAIEADKQQLKAAVNAQSDISALISLAASSLAKAIKVGNFNVLSQIIEMVGKMEGIGGNEEGATYDYSKLTAKELKEFIKLTTKMKVEKEQ